MYHLLNSDWARARVLGDLRTLTYFTIHSRGEVYGRLCEDRKIQFRTYQHYLIYLRPNNNLMKKEKIISKLRIHTLRIVD